MGGDGSHAPRQFGAPARSCEPHLGILERPRGRFADESELLKLFLVASGRTWTQTSQRSPTGWEHPHMIHMSKQRTP